MAVPRAHLLIGKEIFLKKEYLRDLRARLFKNPSDAGLNAQEFSAKNDPLGTVLDFLSTAPFLAETRLAALWDIDKLSEDERESLLAFLGKMPSCAEIVLATEESNAKKNAFVNALSEKARLVTCHPPFEKDLPGWVETRMRKSGKKIDREGARILLERVGHSTGDLDQAITQLCVYVEPRPAVTGADVEKLFGRSADEDAFLLVDSLIEGDAAEAMGKLERLLEGGDKPMELVGILAGQLERLNKASRLVAAGRPSRDVASEMRVHPFFQEKFIRQAERTKPAKLKKIIAGLLACDEAVKSGRMGDRLALERFALEASAAL